jgi:hypothetical protein
MGPSWTLTTPTFNANGTITVNGTAGSGGPVTSTAAAWLLGGNTTTSVQRFGTNTSQHVDFETNNTVRGRFVSNGDMIWGSTATIAPGAATDPLQTYKTFGGASNFWAFDGINTTSGGGGIFGSNTSGANAYAAIEGTHSGTGSGVNGLHLPNSGAGVGVRGTTNSAATGWAGFFTGDVGCTGAYIGSDKRWKKDILPMNSVLNRIKAIEVKTYKMRAEEFPGMSFTPNKTKFGFIAQELKEVFPEIVVQKPIPSPSNKAESRKPADFVDGFHMVDYISLIPVLTKAIQEQQAIIEKLEKRIETLENK